MRRLSLNSLGLATLVVVLGSNAPTLRAQASSAAGDPALWLPESCVLALEVEPPQLSGEADLDSDEARWNRSYRDGIDAIQAQDLAAAEISFCRALAAASEFAPGDIRFAETLDELGLVNFMSGDYAGAEAMQGAAVAEMLLALGPPTADLATAAEKSCRSSLATYMVRFGWVLDRQGRGDEIDLLMREPHRILERGYIPWDSLVSRLDGLITQYLLLEDFAAADRLSALRE